MTTAVGVGLGIGTTAIAVGIDIGTTAVKVGALDLDAPGEPMAVVSRAYPSTRPAPGWVEQDPDAWFDALRLAWAELHDRIGPAEVRSIGICSQVNTHVLVDAGLRALVPAINWQDIRAAEVAAELDAAVADRRQALWGGPFTVDASFALSRLAWLERERPDAVAAAAWLLLPKDHVLARLTGEVVSDPISAIGLVGGDDAYLDDVLGLVPRSRDLLPPLGPIDGAAGAITDDAPAGLPVGVPVAVGTMDAWGDVLGTGLGRPGRAMDVGGTSEIIAVSSERTIPTPGVVSFPPFRGLHLHAGPTQAGGAALAWAADLLGVDLPGVLDLAAAGAEDPQTIVFLPHLAGERAPYWNPDARGTFVGLTSSTEPRHLALAVLEGVALMVRRSLMACEAAAGFDGVPLRLSGGGAGSALWNAIKAAATDRSVELMGTRESSVLGAALLGMAATEPGSDVTELAEHHVRVAERIDPDLDQAARLAELYDVATATYRALEPIFPDLAT